MSLLVAIQTALNTAGSNQILYFPHGSYIVTDTIQINPGARIVGEAWSEIMGTGSNFEDISVPRVMIRVGTAGQTGVIEISDMIFTSKS
jgi:glucan 1,3-beta-glucosidase